MISFRPLGHQGLRRGERVNGGHCCSEQLGASATPPVMEIDKGLERIEKQYQACVALRIMKE